METERDNDRGREILDLVYAQVFEAEAAFARHNIVSGTHALTIGLFGLLRPGDELLSVAGKPYDTLDEVIGISSANGVLNSSCVLGWNGISAISLLLMLCGFGLSFFLGDLEKNTAKLNAVLKKIQKK